ncbi:MAG TPA: ElyC/SanA/YdcF family protein [Bacteroidales bacterium]|nr:ElyC/SanA/YdcF family protein [Bacteroidales bacterium]
MIKFLRKAIYLALAVTILAASFNIYIYLSTRRQIYSLVNDIPATYTALVLGAHVSRSGEPSIFLKDRLDKAIELYRQGKIKRMLLSGDHGTAGYDEVNSMRLYLLEKSVDTQDIFLDHAGFDTYNSVVRAREIFGVDKMIIVSQEFHLSRAVFIANHRKIEAYGIIADKENYGSLSYHKFREKIAGIKAVMEVFFNKRPHFLGEKIPITGDSRLSYDR